MKAAEKAGKIASELKAAAEEKKQENIEQQAQIKEAKEADDAALEEACPQLEAAKEINAQNYDVFKSQNKPKKICILIYALFNDGPGQELWEKAKHYIVDTTFIQKMQKYDVRERCKNPKKMARIAAVLAPLRADSEHVKNSGAVIFPIFYVDLQHLRVLAR